ncbi:MAG: NACHT domain-containing protein [Desulfamplus sp.]|nr:NACHT domain-containing protein [Desulfamplus sp.]
MAITSDEINIKINKELGPEELKKVNDFRSRQDTAVLVIMFTDLKGSTEIAERRGETFTNEMRRLHNQMLLEIIERDNRGIYIKNIGDSIMAVFSEPSVAVERALEIQKKLYDYNSSGLCEEPIIVRIGLHMGQVSVENNTSLDVFGRHVNRAARIESLADGGHIYLSSSVYENAAGWIKDEKYAFASHGEFEVKGISEPVSIFEAYEKAITTPKAPSAPKSKPSWSKSSSNMVISEPLTEDRNNLLILLDKVKTFWVEGVLEKSLYNNIRIELGREYRPDAVEHPWENVLEVPVKNREAVIEGKIILDVFDEFNGYLLITGEPGSGKTITLLELTNELINRAKIDSLYPIPVLFNLSGWDERKYKSLQDYLTDELRSKYQIPKRLTNERKWIEDNRILPLLDGFDEVKKEHRESCLKAINIFICDSGVRGVVVTSRVKEYSEISERLKLNGAVFIKPLGSNDVDEYLNKVDSSVQLKAILEKDQNLKELAASPLMLNIMALSYDGNTSDSANEPISKDNRKSVEETRKELFNHYVERMFRRKGGKEAVYPKEKTIHYLSWLAGKMKQFSKSNFLMEDIDFNWIDTKGYKWSCAFTFSLFTVFLFGLFILFFTLNMTVMVGDTKFHEIINPVNLFFGIFRGVGEGFSTGAIDTIMGFMGFIIVILLASLLGSIGLLEKSENKYAFEKISFSPFFYFFQLAQLAMKQRISLVLLYLFLFLSYVIPLKMLYGEPYIFACYLFYCLMILFLVTFNTKGIPSSSKTTVNEGTKLAVKNSLIMGTIIWIACALPFIFFYSLLKFSFFSFSFIFALVGIFQFGVFNVLIHYLIRLFLYLKNDAPLNYAPFLDHACKLIFLQRVGGGYIFIHRFLLEYFADLGEAEKAGEKQAVSKVN